jgi:protein-tyrosine-phosphatase
MRLLFVCTGNICRSAAAQLLLSSWSTTAGGDLQVSSAGTKARPGQPVHPFTAAALAGSGLDVSGFTARRLSREDVEQADLVLAMTAQHRQEVLELCPRRLRRVYTLLEAVALFRHSVAAGVELPPPGEQGPALADALAGARATRRLSVAEDVADPVMHPAPMHAEVVAQIADALRALPLVPGNLDPRGSAVPVH